MAHFRGTVCGNRGEGSRLGSKKSGLFVAANGWNAGAEIYASVDENGNDVFHVYANGGSNRTTVPKLLGTLKGGEFIPA